MSKPTAVGDDTFEPYPDRQMINRMCPTQYFSKLASDSQVMACG